MVKMPRYVPGILLNAVTRKGDNKQKPQRVKDILGKQVGEFVLSTFKLGS